MRILSEEDKKRAIEYLKFNLMERKWPFYEDVDLEMLLSVNFNDKELALYDGLLKKSAVDAIKLPGGIEKPSNREYWLGLADETRKKISLAIKSGAYEDIKEEMKKSGLFDRFLPTSRGNSYSLKRADSI